MAEIGSEDRQRITDLVFANQILASHGILDGFGHVSVRSAANPGQFYMSRRRAPGLVTTSGVLTLDQDSEPIDDKILASEKVAREATKVAGVLVAGELYGERYIHGEIYRARPDVQAVIHSHSPAVIPFRVANVPLRPVMHMAGFLPAATPVFEIRREHSTGSMLVLSNALGAAVARVLGAAPIVLMRGHGDTVVGASMQEAVFRTIYTELNARVQTDALRLGPTLNYLDAGEIAYNHREINDYARPWEIWKQQATG